MNIIPTRFLPISWMSPLAVPITTRPSDLPPRCPGQHLGLEDGDRHLHRAGGGHHVREVHLAGVEPVADVMDPGHVALVDGLERIDAIGQGLPRQLHRLVGVAVDDALAHRLE